ncbi:helix-turn-helix domain-containing protein [Methylobacter luteus]|uniref:helix-turn-helix domain-containing protein n=1 Tax=Methylobacter luteus TaxID=415 RepID=UPI0003FF2344|nr:helix-turn-helix transcriptional regulator [Methylobacter luteus]
MKTTEIIAANLSLLMQHHGNIRQAALAQNTGISQRTISNVLRHDNTDNITTKTIKALAEYFGIAPYHLMIPNLTIDELTSKQIEQIISAYLKASPEGRENIKRIAEIEARYGELVFNSKS